MENNNKSGVATPAISLPKGGGAVAGIGETFQPNLFSGTGNFSVPIFTSAGRGGFGPQLSLQYSSGNGNGPFGLGWQMSVPRITRKTEKGLPRYDDDDAFVLSGAEELVVGRKKDGTPDVSDRSDAGQAYRVTRFRPRTEGLFARIERWQLLDGNGDVVDTFWRVTTKDNVTSLYGRTPGARIVGPLRPDQQLPIYQWLLEETFDARGNHVLYEYAADDPALRIVSIDEQHREYRQKYLRRIFYGNLPDTFINDGTFGKKTGAIRTQPLATTPRVYCFEVLFDYGDLRVPEPAAPQYRHYHLNTDQTQETFVDEQAPGDPSQAQTAAPIRTDRFSTFRPGFELRTLRRCQRVLMVHHFPELGGSTLVKSTDFEYRENPATGTSFLVGVRLVGYRKEASAYVIKAMPPLEFTYSEFRPTEQRYRSVEAVGGELPTASLDDTHTAFVDVFGNGMPDIVQSGPDGFRYWRNLGGGRIDRPHPLHESPLGVSLAEPGVAFGDAGGDGLADLIVHNRSVAGFFEMTPEGGWNAFRHYHDVPSIDLADPNVRLLDLTGDGLSDILLSRDDDFLWFASKGEDGFEQPKSIPRRRDLDQFPDVYFNDPAGRVRLADMSGDGLNDVVLIHDGRVDYWPNLGYGRFGRRITMANSPRIGSGFDPRRFFLADIDGSGTADLVYVDFCDVHLWFNRSGNGWGERQSIHGTPITTGSTAVDFADFYGNGTSCLIWSYEHGQYPGANYKVLDFCGGNKPHLAIGMTNNMGATTRVRYASSTKFYLEDAAAGRLWATALPFPVQVIEKTEVIDHISRTKLVTCYKYHHGYYDGREREFRGFGRVDQIDTESVEIFSQADLHDDQAVYANKRKMFHVPPVETRTWFHTGAYLDERTLDLRYESEYWRGDGAAFALDDHGFELTDSDVATQVEAHRALRGAALRIEVYGLDGSDKAVLPYKVSENRYRVIEKQPRSGSVHGVFHTVPRDAISYHYERQADDPRIAHEITLAVDEYGNATSVVSIAYPRRAGRAPPEAQAVQERTLISQTETSFCAAIDSEADYRHSDPAGINGYELTGLSRPPDQAFSRAALTGILAGLPASADIPYEATPTAGQIQRRLIERTATVYWNDDVSAPKRHGECAYHGLPHEAYQLALTPGLRTRLFGNRATTAMGREGGYKQYRVTTGMWGRASTGDWWVATGHRRFDPALFFSAVGVTDAFGSDTGMSLDRYGLLGIEVRDPVGNVSKTLVNDYRVLQPQKVEDVNRNRSEVAFDALGVVVATALLSEGDNLNGLVREINPIDIAGLPDNADVLLKNATTRIVYDYTRVQANQNEPNFVHTLARETHVGDLAVGQTSSIRQTRVYGDGFGREIQTKVWAESADPSQLRWRTTGFNRFNNKGNPVQQFEPFFSTGLVFQPDHREGFASTVFYDPLNRAVATLFANRSYEKVSVTPWQQEAWDGNDTVLTRPHDDGDIKEYVTDFIHSFDPAEQYPATYAAQYQARFGNQYVTWYQERISDPANAPPPMSGNWAWAGQAWDETRARQDAAVKAADHAGTFLLSHMDTLGRPFLKRKHDRYEGIDKLLYVKSELDIEGAVRSITDSRQYGNNANRGTPIHNLRNDLDIAGRELVVDSVDAGIRCLLPDVKGDPMYSWDGNGQRVNTKYDAVRRPKEIVVRGDGGERLVTQQTYGDEPVVSGQYAGNLRGRLYQIRDESGVTTNERFDSKGNPTRVRYEMVDDYRSAIDWRGVTPTLGDTFVAESRFDALNRVVSGVAPDGSRYTHKYNDAGLVNGLEVQLWNHAAGSVDGTATGFIEDAEYDAKGQRTRVTRGNGVTTRYDYEPETLRLSRIVSEDANGRTLQHLTYVYDAVGNVVQVHDGAFAPVFNHGARVNPTNIYCYDALYRLREAWGREHQAMTACHYQASGKKHTEAFLLSNQPVNNGQALVNYRQRYYYDEAGNVTRIEHRRPGAPAALAAGWTRNQQYADDSNRLETSDAGCPGENGFSFLHDGNGNIIHDPTSGARAMPHLLQMEWDHANRLRHVVTNVQTHSTHDEAYYVYDANGRRVRKVIERGGVAVEERLYIGVFEVYRRYSATGGKALERQTLQMNMGSDRVALVETTTMDGGAASASVRTRYQLSNHAGSAVLETDEHGGRVSYEEYSPYGGTTFIAGENMIDVERKRYRYIGKERDEETGLYYFGARYYAPFLQRWISPDPILEGLNPYVAMENSPLNVVDPTGLRDEPAVDQQIHFEEGENSQVTADLDRPLWLSAYEAYREARHNKDYRVAAEYEVEYKRLFQEYKREQEIEDFKFAGGTMAIAAAAAIAGLLAGGATALGLTTLIEGTALEGTGIALYGVSAASGGAGGAGGAAGGELMAYVLGKDPNWEEFKSIVGGGAILGVVGGVVFARLQGARLKAPARLNPAVTRTPEAVKILRSQGFQDSQIDDLFSGKIVRFELPNPHGEPTIGFARVQGSRLTVEITSIQSDNVASVREGIRHLQQWKTWMTDVQNLGRAAGAREVQMIAGQVENRGVTKLVPRMGFKKMTQAPPSVEAGEEDFGFPSFSKVLKL